jgi:ribosome biogenesis protein ENP2
VGTPTLKPYMHGYFISLKLYDAARLIANPFAYAEHREKMVREKMEKLAETRIRSKKEVGVKVNKALAEKILREEEKEKKREEKRKLRKAEKGDADMDMEVDEEPVNTTETAEKSSILNDPRFSVVFENPEFAVDEESREYALMNPSAAAQKRNGARGKTAVEDEEEESDKMSSDGLGEIDSESGDSEDGGSDSSDAGGQSYLLLFLLSRSCCSFAFFTTELNKFDPRARPGQKNARAQEAYTRTREQNRIAGVNLVPMRAQTGANGVRVADKNATFGQRRESKAPASGKERSSQRSAEGGMELSWVPSSSGAMDDDDMLVSGGGRPKGKGKERTPGVESFGAGMEKGGEERFTELSESDRKGRTQRRKGVRSGSKNVFRKIDG